MKKLFFRFFYKFGFVHQSTIEPIFKDLKQDISKHKETITEQENRVYNQKQELSRLNKSLQELSSKETESAPLRKEIKSLKHDLSVFKKRCQGYEEREDKLRPDTKKMYVWSKAVKDKFNNKCDICTSSINITAHHLYSKTAHPTLMYVVENGVCLCEECHIEFHIVNPDHKVLSPSVYNAFKASFK